MGIWEYGNMRIWEYGFDYIYIGIWEYGNMGIWEYGFDYMCRNMEYGNMGILEYGNMGIWEYGNMGIWEYENYSTHISATAELVFQLISMCLHRPCLTHIQIKLFFLLLDNLLRPAPWPCQY